MNTSLAPTPEGGRAAANRYGIIVLAASAGGISALSQVLAALPADFPVPIALVQHRTVQLPHLLAQILARHTRLRVKAAEEGETLTPGVVYVARPDLHLWVNHDYTLSLHDGQRIKHLLSAANPLFVSAAAAFPGRALAVVLTGFGSDATDGVQSIKASGGTVIVQNAATSRAFAMPHAAIQTGSVDYVLPLEQIGPMLLRLVQGQNPQEQTGEGDPNAEESAATL